MSESQELPVEIADEPLEIVHVEDASAAMIEYAQKRVQFLGQVLEVSLKNTNHQDWVLMAGPKGPVPYLQASGAEKIGRLFGVKVSRIKKEKWYKEGASAFVWEYTGTFSLPNGESMEVPGSRASDDEFFSSQKHYDERDVKMAAYSNMLVNGITRLLGLRNLTIEQLENAGLSPQSMRGIQFKDKPKAPDVPPEIHQKLRDLVRSIAGTDPVNCQDFLEEWSSFTGREGTTVKGRRSVKDLTPSAAMVTYGKIKQAIDDGKLKVRATEPDPAGPA